MNTLLKKEHYLYGPPMPLLNSGSWNPALHPRNSIGEFIYTDGGRRGKSRPKVNAPGQITIPPHPPNASVDANMRLMRLTANLNPLGKYFAFHLLVQAGGAWDYKDQPSDGANPQYQAFGNFNY